MASTPHYVIIGNGRMASHCQNYLNALNLNVQQWNRSQPTDQLHSQLNNATHALVLISDDYIEHFIRQTILPHHTHLMILHFSGALTIDCAYATHPLQTFPNSNPYTLDEYQQVPFVIEDNAPDFSVLLPNLPNPHYRINPADKPYYHAMCVLANNVGTLLWQKFFKEMETRFHIQQQDLLPFLKRTLENIADNPLQALSGPLARGDRKTLEKNYRALKDDPFEPLFKTILETLTRGAPHEIDS